MNNSYDNIQIEIKLYKRYTSQIIDFYSSYLFDIQTYPMDNKKLFIVKKIITGPNAKIKNIIGTFIINFNYNVLESLYIKEEERSKGYGIKIIEWVQKQKKINNWNNLYLDCYNTNTIAIKFYEKYLKFIKTITHSMFKKIYGYNPGKNIKILRFSL